MTRVDNVDDVEGATFWQTDPLPVNHVEPTEPDVVSSHVEDFGGTKRSYWYLKHPEVVVENNNANPRFRKGLAKRA